MTHDLVSARLIVVGGAPRSGTTLVQRILDSHSLIYGGPEFDLLPEIMRLRSRFLDEIRAGRISEYLNEENANAIFESFLVSLFQKKVGEIGKVYLSEKTPSNLEAFPELRACLPNAHFIFVMRDPRAIVASMLEVGRRYVKDLKIGALVQVVKQVVSGRETDALQTKYPSLPVPPPFTRNTRRAIEYINYLWMRGNKARDGADNILVVYYEEIVEQPEKAIRRIMDFLQIPFEESLLNIQERKWDMPKFQSGEQYWYTREQLQTPIENASLQKWREVLGSYDLYLIHKHLICIPGLTDRYDLQVQGRPWWVILDAWGRLFAGLRKMFVQLCAALSKAL